MAEIIKCPVCGESNPANQEFCQHCQSRLQPGSGPLKGVDAPIKPGQIPTKKNTAELEPILPQWLRDARDSARNTEQQEGQQASQKPGQTQPASHTEDLLAGLRSQAADGDEDETPDWLASITGAAPKPKKSTSESSEVRWVELGDKADFAQEETADDAETPSWLASLTPTGSQADEKDELTEWFRDADDSKPTEKAAETPAVDDIFSTSAADDTPDWLRRMAAEDDAKKAQPPSFDSSSNAFPPEASESPDWLRQIAADSPADELKDTPDWLRGMEDKNQSTDSAAFTGPASSEVEAFDPSSKGELPAWLNDQGESAAKPLQDTTPKWLKKEAEDSGTGELPAWLSGNEETIPLPAAQEEENLPAKDEDALAGLPDWLKAAAPQASIFEQPEEKTTAEAEPADASFDSPDWLNTFTTAETPAPEKETPFEVPPAFVEEAKGETTDELFTEMPDWLSNAMDLPASSSPTPITNTDAIAPGELPSWVQAMRPVDEPLPSLSSSFVSSDQTLESRGALAGLQGVLPAVPGYSPTSKPKPYSIRLQTSDEQLAHAELLEQILAAETAPVPIASFSTLRGSRGLRWFLFFMVFVVVIAALLLPAPIFSMPVGVPREVGGAVDVARAIPADGAVLVAVDYEASRVGEIEAAAAPFFDQMIFYSHPRLTFISTNETGAILAERFISGPLAEHYKNNGFSYLNLGYLPGGQLGIHAFAQNPHVISPLDISLQPAWASASLEGVSSLSQFAALVLITDNAESARVWIEQTESARGNIPFVVITSAQAAPMIQPYYDSQQVSGMVAGLYGGAVFEQNNAGRPGTARNYWDAYSLGMLLAMSLVLGGGLWNLALGLRDRASAREAK